MVEKTFQGRTCPKCTSFLPEGSGRCPVCGFSAERGDGTEIENGPTVPARTDGVIVCAKCGTQNLPGSRFCKICKHPLKEDVGERTDIIGRTRARAPIGESDRRSLILAWERGGEGHADETKIELAGSGPFIAGACEWRGYVFFLYAEAGVDRLLGRRVGDDTTAGRLFKPEKGLFVLESGRDFHLGGIRFRVLGDLSERERVRTVVKTDRTVMRRPAERESRGGGEGAPRLLVLPVNAGEQAVEIEKPTVVGRSFLTDHCGIGAEELSETGITEEHLMLEPRPGGRWILEPLQGQSVFVEIGRTPVPLPLGGHLRWLHGDVLEQFSVYIEERES